jgi:diguanylate cyclase (GGDEF)-like protein
MEAHRGRIRDVAYLIALGLAIAVVATLVGLLVARVEADTFEEAAVPLMAAALVAALAALLGWHQERGDAVHAQERDLIGRQRLEDEAHGRDPATVELQARIDQLEAELAEKAGQRAALEQQLVGKIESAQEESEATKAKLEQTEASLEETRRKLDRERQARSRSERARELEREWNRELREQVVHLHQERGVLGDTSDIRALVLHIAVTLLDAEKGMLLQRSGSNGSTRLEVHCSEGFENDPRESRLAQRFAGEVIEQDTTLLEDSHEIDDDDGTPADREIDNIAAIPIYVQDEFSGVIVCANRKGGFEECEDEVLLAIGDQAGAVLENQRLKGGLRGAYFETVQVLADAIQAKDPHLRGHSEEVVQYVAAVADRLGLDKHRREEILFGSLLHDLGKIGISERILLKPAALTPEERSVIELHPRIGYRLVERVEALKPIASAILHHHERWDGDGYPAGLSGEAIPLEARIIGVADSFSAMTADRPYRRRMTLDDACAELERCAGSQFDPAVVEAFVDEVRTRPPSGGEHPLEAALADPEVAIRRKGGETVIGHAPLALTDNLTLLYTHRYFHEAVESHTAAGESFAIVVVELTELPQLNRIEGYAAGDAAIVSAARALQRAAVRCGGTACRYSGRRLALVCPDCDPVQAERIAAELAEALADGPRAAVGVAALQDGDQGADVVARAPCSRPAAPSPPGPRPPPAGRCARPRARAPRARRPPRRSSAPGTRRR